MADLGFWVLILVFSSLPLVLGSPMQNRWGWLYNNGRELDRERKVNIIAMMLQTAGNVAATSAFVRVCDNTTRKWWNHWLTTGTFEKQKEKPGPKPRLGAASLIYLFFLVKLENAYSILEYRERLQDDLGIVASDWVIMRALQRLGLHRKRPATRKIEAMVLVYAYALVCCLALMCLLYA